MTDIRSKVEGDRNFFERVLHAVPGFRGYLRREERREADTVLRENLGRELASIVSRLDAVSRQLTNVGRLAAVDEVGWAREAVERIRRKLRHASSGRTGMFSAVKIGEEELDRLYRFDASLVDRIPEIAQAVVGVEEAAAGKAELGVWVEETLSAVRAFESHFDGRMKLISRETSIDLSGD